MGQMQKKSYLVMKDGFVKAVNGEKMGYVM
jgi:hypothetical protein